MRCGPFRPELNCLPVREIRVTCRCGQSLLSGRTIPGVTFGGSCTRNVPGGVWLGLGAFCTGFPSTGCPTCTSFGTSQVSGTKPGSSTTQQGVGAEAAPASLPDDFATTDEPHPPQNFALSAAGNQPERQIWGLHNVSGGLVWLLLASHLQPRSGQGKGWVVRAAVPQLLQ